MNETPDPAMLKLAGAALGGYVLGRFKKGRAAISFAMWMAGAKDPKRMLRDGLLSAAQTPEAQQLLSQLRGPALEAGRRVAAATFENQVGALTSALQHRTKALTDRVEQRASRRAKPSATPDRLRSAAAAQQGDRPGQPKKKARPGPRNVPRRTRTSLPRTRTTPRTEEGAGGRHRRSRRRRVRGGGRGGPEGEAEDEDEDEEEDEEDEPRRPRTKPTRTRPPRTRRRTRRKSPRRPRTKPRRATTAETDAEEDEEDEEEPRSRLRLRSPLANGVGPRRPRHPRPRRPRNAAGEEAPRPAARRARSRPRRRAARRRRRVRRGEPCQAAQRAGRPRTSSHPQGRSPVMTSSNGEGQQQRRRPDGRARTSPAVVPAGRGGPGLREGARVGDAVKKVGNKLTGVTGSLHDKADGGGFKGAAVDEAVRAASPRVTARSRPRSAASVSGIKEKVKGALRQGGGAGGNKKFINIIEDIHVGVPVDVAYNQWTQFQEFAQLHEGRRVGRPDRRGEQQLAGEGLQVPPQLEGQGHRADPRPADRLDQRGREGHDEGCRHLPPARRRPHPGAAGHRVLPQGLFEKTGNIWRAQGRRARLDLKHFRRFVMISGEATGSWRGEIRDGEVVRGPTRRSRAGPAAEDNAEDEAEDEGEDEASEEDDGRGGRGRRGAGRGRGRLRRRGRGRRRRRVRGRGRGSRTSAEREPEPAGAR